MEICLTNKPRNVIKTALKKLWACYRCARKGRIHPLGQSEFRASLSEITLCDDFGEACAHAIKKVAAFACHKAWGNFRLLGYLETLATGLLVYQDIPKSITSEGYHFGIRNIQIATSRLGRQRGRNLTGTPCGERLSIGDFNFMSWSLLVSTRVRGPLSNFCLRSSRSRASYEASE